MAEYNRIKDTTLSSFFSKLKAFFWHKDDVVNVPLATVATTGDYNDLINKPSGGGTLPFLEMTVPSSNDAKYTGIGGCWLNSFVSSRRVVFTVEGVSLDFVEIFCITDNQVIVQATQDETTGEWEATFDTGGLYRIESYHSDIETNETTYYDGLFHVAVPF